VRLWHAIMAGLQVFSGGSILTDLLPKAYVGMLVLVVAALQAGTIMYMKSEGPEYQGKHAQVNGEAR